MKRRTIIMLGLAAAMALGLAACSDGAADAETATGAQAVVIEGFDWGPAVTKTILSLDREVAADSIAAECFSVKEKVNGTIIPAPTPSICLR